MEPRSPTRAALTFVNDRSRHAKRARATNARTLALAVALALGAASRGAEADPDIRPIVVVSAGEAGPWVTELRQTIASELHADAVAPDDARAKEARGIVTISLSRSDDELLVRYQPAQGSEIVRRVRAPNGHAHVVRAATLLTGNLVRNEAQEILGELPSLHPSPPRSAKEGEEGAPTSPPPEATSPPSPPTPPASPSEPPASSRPSPSLSRSSLSLAPQQPCDNLRASAPFHPVALSLVYPLATNIHHPDVRTPFALNLLYGRVGYVEGADIGVFGHVGCDVRGAQVQAGIALAGGDVRGAQIANVAAWAGETVMGVQAAIGLSRAVRVEGAQIGGVDIARESRGAQIGLASFSHDLQGAQLGLMTVSRTIDGGQFGLANVAGDVAGVQIGLVNIARHVKGFQLGIVNISEDVDGVAIGALNLSKSGYIRPIVWGGTSTYLNGNVGVRFDLRWVYVQTSIGYVDGSDFNDAALSSAGGFHVLKPDEEGFLFDLEVGNQSRLGAKSEQDDKQRGLVHAIAGWRVAPRLAFFAGMGIVYSQRRNDPFIGPDLIGGAIF